MRKWIVRLTVFSFGMHLLLGCCWHHAHAAPAGCEHAAAEHQHDHHSPADHDREFPSDCAGVCQYLPVIRTLIDADSILPLVVFSEPPAEAVSLPEIDSVDSPLGAIRYGPTPRLHLLHCLLLI